MVITFRIIIQILKFQSISIWKKKTFVIIRSVIQHKKVKVLKKTLFDKTQKNGLFISPKQKNAILEMSLKSFIMSKLDYHKNFKKSSRQFF